MSLPTSSVDICNLSCDVVGEAPIATISPPVTNTEKKLARNYDLCRRKAARIGIWNCCKARAIITRDSVAPAFGFSDRYLLPNDSVRFLRVDDTDSAYTSTMDWKVEGRYLLANASGANSLKVHYVRDETDITIWDPLFTELVVLMTALSISYQITKQQKLTEQINKLISMALPDALSVDGQEGPPKRRQRSRAVNARMYGINDYPGRYTVFSD